MLVALKNKRLWLLCSLTFGTCCGQNLPVHAQNASPDWPLIQREQNERTALARRQFVEVMTISRAPQQEQARQAAQLYQLFSEIKEERVFFGPVIYLRAPMPPNATDLSPEALADYITNRVGGRYLSIEAKANLLTVLSTNLEAIQPLIRSDLRSADSAKVERGLETLRKLGNEEVDDDFRGEPGVNVPQWMSGFYEDVEKIFERAPALKPSIEAFDSQPALDQQAAWTLVVLHDTRAIGLLIAKDPLHPARYYENLASLSRRDSKNPALLTLVPKLDSTDARQRFEALYALDNIDKAVLLPYVKRLLDDSDPKVRGLAVNRAFVLDNSEFQQLRPQLLLALNDRDESVQLAASWGFTWKKDAVVAPTLLKLIQSPTTSLSIKSAVADNIRHLMGNTFDYISDGSVVPQPSIVVKNQRAISKFEKWIEDNPAKLNA